MSMKPSSFKSAGKKRGKVEEGTWVWEGLVFVSAITLSPTMLDAGQTENRKMVPAPKRCQ